MRLGVLFSGGKDSTYALYKVMEKEQIVCLITIVSKNRESYMFHTPNIEITSLQAEAIGLPLIQMETEGIKEKELEDLEKAVKKAIKDFKIEGVVTGAVESVYQSSRIKKICDKLKIKCISPLWKKNQEELLREILNDGFKFIISSIAAEGLDESWLGKVVTKDDVDKLVEINKKTGISIAFEGGEAETLVIDGPIFKSKIIIQEAIKIMTDSCTGIYKISKARLL